MPSASIIRLQIESMLSHRIPSALTPSPKMNHPVSPTGVGPLDEVLQGGLPMGAISEFVGPECSGRTSVALSFLSRITQESKACAWVDVSNVFDPASAAATGIDLARLLWIRCGLSKSVPLTSREVISPDKFPALTSAERELNVGEFEPHPRGKAKGLSKTIRGFLASEAKAPDCAEPQHWVAEKQQAFESIRREMSASIAQPSRTFKPWSRMEQALHVTDLLLQNGGFSAIVLDMGSFAPEFVSRVPLATWFRYRVAAERTQSSILVLTQYVCAKNSAELLLRFLPGSAICDETTVFTGIENHVEVFRRRFAQAEFNVVPLQKPSQNHVTSWQSRTSWTGYR
jgi:recombination protein RecA